MYAYTHVCTVAEKKRHVCESTGESLHFECSFRGCWRKPHRSGIFIEGKSSISPDENTA